MPCGRSLHTQEDPPLSVGAIAVHQVVRQRLVVRHGGERRKREQRLDLGREQEVSRRLGVVKGLDAEPVARTEQPATVAIPDRECEHPLDARETVLTPAQIRVEQYLGVGTCRERRASPLELGAELAVIVDLSVEDDPHPPPPPPPPPRRAAPPPGGGEGAR